MRRYAYNLHMNKLEENNSPMKALEESLDTDFFKVLSEPARIELIKLLLRMPNSDIGTISSQMLQDRSVISRHLKVMMQAGLVTCQKEGKHSYYCLNGSEFIDRFEQILLNIKQATTNNCC